MSVWGTDSVVLFLKIKFTYSTIFFLNVRVN